MVVSPLPPFRLIIVYSMLIRVALIYIAVFGSADFYRELMIDEKNEQTRYTS